MIVMAAMVMSAGAAHAQQLNRPATISKHPNFNGIWQALNTAYWNLEGHSVEELAAMTGLNENTIKVKLFRTRQKLLKAAQRLNRIRS